MRKEPIMLTETQKKRLLKVAQFIRKTVPNNLLDQTMWIGADQNGHSHAKASIKCGTPACYAGWATAVYPQLMFDTECGELILMGRVKGYKEMQQLTRFTSKTLEKFFGTSSGKLFGGYKRTPKMQANIVEKFVKRGIAGYEYISQYGSSIDLS